MKVLLYTTIQFQLYDNRTNNRQDQFNLNHRIIQVLGLSHLHSLECMNHLFQCSLLHITILLQLYIHYYTHHLTVCFRHHIHRSQDLNHHHKFQRKHQLYFILHQNKYIHLQPHISNHIHHHHLCCHRHMED